MRVYMSVLEIRWVFFLLLLISCKDLDEAQIGPGTDYQPLELGAVWEYKVLETNYFGESDQETHQYFYKDSIASHYFNEVGEQVFLVHRMSSDDRRAWRQDKVFTYRVSKNTLIRTVDNVAIACLVFPPSDGQRWDGNIYSALPENTFSLELYEKYPVGDQDFSSTAKVVQSEEDDRITLRDNRFEVYAKGVGLVESYYEVLSYCTRNDCVGEQIISTGRFVHLELIGHG